jgi:hypothetical protein
MVEAGAGIPAAVLARFTAAEGRLYPMAMVDAERYQRATALVGLLVAQLRESCADLGAVLDRRGDLLEQLPVIADDAQLRLAGLPADDIVDAASALRCRELQAADGAAARNARMAHAKTAGQAWFVAEEADPEEVMAGSYRRVELHLPTGSTMITSMEAGRSGASASYQIELIPARTASGSAASQTWVYPDQAAWVAAAERLRAELAAEA